MKTRTPPCSSSSRSGGIGEKPALARSNAVREGFEFFIREHGVPKYGRCHQRRVPTCAFASVKQDGCQRIGTLLGTDNQSETDRLLSPAP
ncbi:hypothetical protein ACH47Z_39680 [Streptomyces sp. NPDC020192]|uniref:hypothetical protein n=1 Tax=Streptomyces sp. NPDC020192 TaxID=3365066 RepID=UPI0037B2BCDF